MLSKTMQDAINQQINKELYSSYVYLSMAAYFENQNLPGAAQWMRKQSAEETEHGMKFFEFLIERGGAVLLQTIAQPAIAFGSPLAAFQEVLAHEQKVTQSIHDLYALAVKEADYPTQVLLHWFINEQVEEEKNATGVVEQLKMVGDSPAALFMIDRQLAARN